MSYIKSMQDIDAKVKIAEKSMITLILDESTSMMWNDPPKWDLMIGGV